SANGDAAQNGGSGIDDHIVLDDGMSGVSFQQDSMFIRRESFRAQCDGLIDADMFADDSRFSNHHACSVVDEKTALNLCAGVDVDPCQGVGNLGDQAGDEECSTCEEFVCQPEVHDRCDAGVADQNLVHAAGGGVSLVSSKDITFQKLAYSRKLIREITNDRNGPVPQFSRMSVFIRKEL